MKPALIVLAPASALLLAACSSSTTSGHASASVTAGTASTPASTPASGSASAPSSAPSTAPVSAPVSSAGPAGTAPAANSRALFEMLQAGVLSAHSLHLSLTSKSAGTSVVASGDEALAAGTLTALDLREQVGGQNFRIVYSGGKAYAQLPASISRSTKPWALVSTRSANPAVKAFATALLPTLGSNSVASYSLLAQAASSVRSLGPSPVGGVPATRYAIVVDVAKLSAKFPNRDALQSSGLKTIPVELWVDGRGRPVKVTESFTVAGQHADIAFLATNYDEPVHISAPPASQVDTK